MRALPRFTAVMAFAALAAPAEAATRVVDDDRTQCPNAAFTTVQAAVDAAVPGDTVRVCAGTYLERVRVDRTIRLHGARRGSDARSRVFGNASESVIRSPFPLILSADGIVVDGFSVIVELDEEGEGTGISGAGAGFQILNNLIEDDLVSGIILRSVGDATTVIARNHFRGRLGFTADSEHLVRNVVIRDNLFRNASLLLVGEAHSNIRVLRNTFLYQASAPTRCTQFSQFNCRPLLSIGSTVDVLVLQNTISGSGDDAMALAGNTRLTVQDNRLRNGRGRGISASGANTDANLTGNGIANFRGAGVRVVRASGVLLEGNEVEDNGNGVLVLESNGNRIAANSVEDNRALGIDVQASSDNTFSDNEARGNAEWDCRDQTTGGGSFGTANTWSGNEGSRSSPAGLCPDG